MAMDSARFALRVLRRCISVSRTLFSSAAFIANFLLEFAVGETGAHERIGRVGGEVQAVQQPVAPTRRRFLPAVPVITGIFLCRFGVCLPPCARPSEISLAMSQISAPCDGF